METLRAAYEMAKRNDGAPGIDGVTFEAIEVQGVEALLEQLRDELIGRTYQPLPARRQEIPKDGGKVRVRNVGIMRSPVRASIHPTTSWAPLTGGLEMMAWRRWPPARSRPWHDRRVP
jgi:retron-type reverse transcriptase